MQGGSRSSSTDRDYSGGSVFVQQYYQNTLLIMGTVFVQPLLISSQQRQYRRAAERLPLAEVIGETACSFESTIRTSC